MLDDRQKLFYRENGYLLVKQAVGEDLLGRLQRTTYRLIEESRSVTESDGRYDLDAGHSAEHPKLTRIKLPTHVDPVYREALMGSGLTDVLRELLGANVSLITSKLNTKAPGGGAAVEWHQDWAFYPHTNDSVLALGLMLEDVTFENGPLMVIPGSHRGPVLSHHNKDGVFCGAIDPDDPEFDFSKAVTLTGKAGDMTVHHVRTLHGSAPNNSNRTRLILFFECNASDAWQLMGGNSYIHRLDQQALWEDMAARIVCGERMTQPRLKDCPVRLPIPPAPDAGSIFQTQRSGRAKSAFAARALP